MVKKIIYDFTSLTRNDCIGFLQSIIYQENRLQVWNGYLKFLKNKLYSKSKGILSQHDPEIKPDTTISF